MTRLSTILDQIDSGTVLLPEFQRGYVWNRDQVRGLMRSLYLGYPVGPCWCGRPRPTRNRGPGARGAVRCFSSMDSSVSRPSTDRARRAADILRRRPSRVHRTAFQRPRRGLRVPRPGQDADDPRWIDVTALFGPKGRNRS